MGFFLREVDVENLNIPYFFRYIGSGIGRNVILSIIFIVIIIHAALNWVLTFKLIKNFSSSLEGIGIFSAAILLFIGDYFERNNAITHHVFLEEVFELLGFILILVVSLMLSRKKSS